MQTRLRDINIIEIYKKWQYLSHMFECFVHSTSFATLKNYPDFEITKVSTEIDSPTKPILEIVKKHLCSSTLFFIDLPISRALAYVNYLNHELQLMPVLTVRHINHQYGLVGNKNIISCLIEYSSLMSTCNPAGFIFVLDSQRYSDFEDSIYITRFNNQYEITEYDLPPIEMLKEFGYSKAVFIYEDTIKEDLNEYKDYLIENELNIICYNVLTHEEIMTDGQKRI